MAKEPAANWIIERLAGGHDRTGFECGQAALDDWIKLRAGQYDKKDLARTYVAVREGEAIVLGYYAIATHRVAFEALDEKQAKGLPRIDVPVVLLGRLAVDLRVQGQGLGALVLVDALRRAQHLSEQIGIRGVEVDAIDEAAQRFYVQFGFTPLVDAPRHLFLPMQVIRKMDLPPLSG